MARIAFLGLGAMGRRMAAHLVADHDLVVYNRTPGPEEPLVAAGATAARTPREAAAGASVVLSMVTDVEASQAIWQDSDTGAIRGLAPGALAIECSTLSPDAVRVLSMAVTGAGARFVEAPVVGSLQQADNALLLALCGGEEADVAAAAPVLSTFAQGIRHIGPTGSGAAMKLVVNSWFAIQVEAMAEVLELGGREGIDRADTAALLAGLRVTSPALGGLGKLMVSGPFLSLFPIRLVAKDLRYAVAASHGDDLPLLRATRDRFEQADAAGHGELNIHGIVKLGF